MSDQSISAVHSEAAAAEGKVSLRIFLNTDGGKAVNFRLTEGEAIRWISVITAAIKAGHEHCALEGGA